MPATRKKEPLNNHGLVVLLENEMRTFSDDYFPLHSNQVKGIRRCTALVDTNESEIGDNSPRRRARTILTDLWTHVPEAFFLCSLAINQTRLGTLTSTDYMKSVLQWWNEAKVPSGVTKTIDRHLDALPTISRDQRQISLVVSSGDILEFLQQNFGHQKAEMVLPFSGKPLPSVRLNGKAKIELSWELANSFTREYKLT